ncbi:hypothetical protein GCM10009560_34920 [Nonomuraea longicatena]|uniref:Mutator family transposase n=1 Tax=Nonomuraea longicatena TaxID=83682 RepID=A0ABP4A249_9ACTN
MTAGTEALMSAEADGLCGAGYGERSDERTNRRNGYRTRDGDTRAGSIELAIPKLRSGSYFPDWLLERRRRAEQALISVVATGYLLGVSTRRVDRLVEQLGIKHISKSQVSQMAKTLDEQVEAFRTRVLDAGPYTFVWLDALTQKVREGGRIVNVHVLVATAVNADGRREILGLDVTSAEDGAWMTGRSISSRAARMSPSGISAMERIFSQTSRSTIAAVSRSLRVRIRSLPALNAEVRSRSPTARSNTSIASSADWGPWSRRRPPGWRVCGRWPGRRRPGRGRRGRNGPGRRSCRVVPRSGLNRPPPDRGVPRAAPGP